MSALEEAAGCQAEIVGKPSESFYRRALDSLASHGFARSEIGMIGKIAVVCIRRCTMAE